MSRRILLSILHPRLNERATYDLFHELAPGRNSLGLLHHHHQQQQQRLQPQRKNLVAPTLSFRRHASSSSASSDKPFVLEKPDKFRPPSHPQRLNRRPPRQYPGPPLSEPEREAQKVKRYPHMFPNEGTRMHWFLTNRWIHVWISLGTLSLLAFISLTQYFILTSPYSHLIPAISSFPRHPIRFVSEWISVIRLHIEYTSEKTAESRRQNILDAQKRRLYRRAHGLEDLDASQDQGIDVRGLVDWDDGLTNKERREGGRRARAITGKQILDQGGQVGDALEASPIAVASVGGADAVMEVGGVDDNEAAAAAAVAADDTTAEDEVQATPKKKKVKRWLGIWE